MTRHSKNNTDGAVFTYHEKKNAGFGSKKVRLGADSARNFDCCSLSLQPCREPMVSPDGYLFDKEYIYENLLRQKKGIKSRLKEWEEQEAERAREQEEAELRKVDEQREKFSILETGTADFSGKTAATDRAAESAPGTTSVRSHGVDVTNKLQNNFWLPTNTPQAKKDIMSKKPDSRTKNPVSDLPLRPKELLVVKFTPVNAKKMQTMEEEKQFGRYICPVCSKSLTNTVKSAVLRPSGNVICSECVDRFVKKEHIDPVTSKRINPAKDVIFLKSGGTAYSASGGGAKEAKQYQPSMRV